MEDLHVMSEEKRRRIFDMLNAYEGTEEDIYKKKLEKERKRIAAKRKIVVNTVIDLIEKYEDYDININKFHKTAILREPIEVNYYLVFREECEGLGYTCGVEEK